MSESVPLFVVPDAGWGVGWEAGLAKTPLALDDMKLGDYQLSLCLRINYVPKHVVDSMKNGDYVTDYVSNKVSNDALVPSVHQQIDRLIQGVREDCGVRVTEYVTSFGGGTFVAFFVNDGVPLVRVFCQEEDAEKWRNTIATDNWSRKFVDDPPKVGIADEYFARMPVTTYFKVYSADLVM